MFLKWTAQFHCQTLKTNGTFEHFWIPLIKQLSYQGFFMLKKAQLLEIGTTFNDILFKMQGKKGGMGLIPKWSALQVQCNTGWATKQVYDVRKYIAYKWIHNTYEAGCETNVKMYLYTNHALL